MDETTYRLRALRRPVDQNPWQIRSVEADAFILAVQDDHAGNQRSYEEHKSC